MRMFVVALLLLPAAPGEGADPLTVLREWDAARTTAYAEGDRAGLADLYVPGAGRADLTVLDGFRRRGLVVWQRTQVFAARVRRNDGERIELRVTDRTMTVVGDGTRCRALPTTQPRTRDVAFVLTGDEWRVESVRPVPPAAPR